MNTLHFWNASWTAAIGNHLLQSTVVAGLAWLLVMALRNNHARARYAVWMAASLKFLLPFSLLVALGAQIKPVAQAPIVQKPAVVETLRHVTRDLTQPMPQIDIHYANAAEETKAAASKIDFRHWLPAVLLMVWACGFVVVCARWMRSWLQVRRALHDAMLLNLDTPIPAYATKHRIEPGIFGVFKQVLLLPAGIPERLTQPQMDAILAHEMCHARRRDNLTYAMHMLVEAIFWFHPGVWWIGNRMIEERELACDEAVVSESRSAEVYAEGILNVCKFYVESPLACVAGVTGADLKQRIVRIMTEHVSKKLDMKKKLLLAAAICFAVLLPLTLGLAQTAAANHGITDTWQGTLHLPDKGAGAPAKDLRLVAKITKDDKGALKADFFSIDQGAQPFSANVVTLTGDDLKIEIKIIGGTFTGKWSADKNSIVGTWEQGGGDGLPLTLVRATPETAWEIPKPAAPEKPMAADADPSFDVATIKPNNSGATRLQGINVRGRNFITRATSLDDLLRFFYHVQDNQVIGLPDWAHTYRFDINALPDVEGVPNTVQVGTMVHKLLADRFALKYHHEKRQMNAYVLTVVDASKLTPTQLHGNLPGIGFRPDKSGLTMIVRNGTMSDMIDLWQTGFLDRPIVDKTGLTGKYDIDVTFTPDDSVFGGNPPPGLPKPADGVEPAPNFFKALASAGLKLEPQKTDVDVLVIDNVQKPSEN